MTATLSDATVPAADGAMQRSGPPKVRVALREIRELAYRALVAVGASSGEAATAATAVLHAELHSGAGLLGLVADLRRGPWPEHGLTCTRRLDGVLEVTPGGRTGELRVGTAVVDLVAGEPEPAVAVTAAEGSVAALYDAPLLAAARTTGVVLTAATRAAGGGFVVRLATPTGDLRHGRADLAALVGDARVAGDLVVASGVEVPPALAGLARQTAAERSERRRAAARRGVEVDEPTWRVVVAHAHRFLVPERDA